MHNTPNNETKQLIFQSNFHPSGAEAFITMKSGGKHQSSAWSAEVRCEARSGEKRKRDESAPASSDRPPQQLLLLDPQVPCVMHQHHGSCSIGVSFSGMRPSPSSSFPEMRKASKVAGSSFQVPMRGSSSHPKAEQFVDKVSALKNPLTATDPDPEHPSTLVAFCDGSAIGNGKSGCRAGWACIFPHNLK